MFKMRARIGGGEYCVLALPCTVVGEGSFECVCVCERVVCVRVCARQREGHRGKREREEPG